MGRVAYNDGYDHDPEVYGNGLPGWLLAQLDMQRQQQEGGAFRGRRTVTPTVEKHYPTIRNAMPAVVQGVQYYLRRKGAP